jgi:hypothetical protein
MIALSRLLSVGILAFLVVFFVWLYALMKTSKQADRMSQRWIEKQWLAEHRRWEAAGKPMDDWFAPHVIDHGLVRCVHDSHPKP